MSRTIFLVIFLLGAAAQLSAQPISDRDFQKQNILARVYEETRDFANAIRVYSDLHKARPGEVDVSEGLFRCLYYMKRYGQADTLLEERIATEHESFELDLNLARVRSRLNRKSDALDAFARAVKFAKGANYYSNSVIVAQTMIEAGYQEEALAMLIKQRESSEQPELFTDQIAGLYFKLAKYEEGAKEYLDLLKINGQDLMLVEQRIAQFTADTSVRRSIIRIFTSHIDIDGASVPELRLLGWCYGELKNYQKEYQIYLKLDDGDTGGRTANGGYELYNFAELTRKEGALDVAAKAYDEALRRFRQTDPTNPMRIAYASKAEIGALETKEAYWRKMPEMPLDSLKKLVSEYRSFADGQAQIDLAADALSHAGELAFKVLHDYHDAQFIYENILARFPAFSPNTRDAYFALESVALAQADLQGAALRLDVLSDILSRRNRPGDDEIKKHILFERARIDFYAGNFDTCLVKLDSVIADPNSDYANDAIGLHSLITENRGNDAALKLFAKAELQSLGNDLNAALSAYRSIPETYPDATIADESVLRAVEILIDQKKPADAVTMLENMQEKMRTSPLLDKAAFREAEIIEVKLKDKAKALRMYEDFLERFPKSSYSAEVRKRARTLRGDSF